MIIKRSKLPLLSLIAVVLSGCSQNNKDKLSYDVPVVAENAWNSKENLQKKMVTLYVKYKNFNGDDEYSSIKCLDACVESVKSLFDQLYKRDFRIYSLSAFTYRITTNTKADMSTYCYGAAIATNYVMNPFHNISLGQIIPTRYPQKPDIDKKITSMNIAMSIIGRHALDWHIYYKITGILKAEEDLQKSNDKKFETDFIAEKLNAISEDIQKNKRKLLRKYKTTEEYLVSKFTDIRTQIRRITTIKQDTISKMIKCIDDLESEIKSALSVAVDTKYTDAFLNRRHIRNGMITEDIADIFLLNGFDIWGADNFFNINYMKLEANEDIALQMAKEDNAKKRKDIWNKHLSQCRSKFTNRMKDKIKNYTDMMKLGGKDN